jgi:hypothetical protein
VFANKAAFCNFLFFSPKPPNIATKPCADSIAMLFMFALACSAANLSAVILSSITFFSAAIFSPSVFVATKSLSLCSASNFSIKVCFSNSVCAKLFISVNFLS